MDSWDQLIDWLLDWLITVAKEATPDVPHPSISNTSLCTDVTSIWSSETDDEGFTESYEESVDDLFEYESDLECLSDDEDVKDENDVLKANINAVVEQSFAGQLSRDFNIMGEMVSTCRVTGSIKIFMFYALNSPVQNVHLWDAVI